MKKLLFILVLTGLLASCGEKVEFTSTKNKEIMVENVFDKKDMTAKTEYEKIMKKLQEQADGGNKEAQEEIDAWNKVKEKLEAKQMSRVSKETEEWVKKQRAKKGYGWI